MNGRPSNSTWLQMKSLRIIIFHWVFGVFFQEYQWIKPTTFLKLSEKEWKGFDENCQHVSDANKVASRMFILSGALLWLMLKKRKQSFSSGQKIQKTILFLRDATPAFVKASIVSLNLIFSPPVCSETVYAGKFRPLRASGQNNPGIFRSHWVLSQIGSVHVRKRWGWGWGVGCVGWGWVTASLQKWDKYGILQQLPWLTARWHNPTQLEALRPQTATTSWWEHSSWRWGNKGWSVKWCGIRWWNDSEI